MENTLDPHPTSPQCCEKGCSPCLGLPVPFQGHNPPQRQLWPKGSGLSAPAFGERGPPGAALVSKACLEEMRRAGHEVCAMSGQSGGQRRAGSPGVALPHGGRMGALRGSRPALSGVFLPNRGTAGPADGGQETALRVGRGPGQPGLGGGGSCPLCFRVEAPRNPLCGHQAGEERTAPPILSTALQGVLILPNPF